MLSNKVWEIWREVKHCSIQDSVKVWCSALPLMYLVIYENRYKVHSLLSGTFERSAGKMFWGIIFACGGSESSKGLLTQERGGTAAVDSSQYSCWKRFPETMSREASWEALWCSTDMSMGLQCILGQSGLSDLQERFISCPPASLFITGMTVSTSWIQECTHSMLISTDML